jgi:hypothetical protein
MNPEIWGPGAWLFLHSITLAYPNNPTQLDKENYKTFFETLKNVIPCKKCSYNYSKNIKDNDISEHLDSKVSLVKWLVNIHNQVNIENNKKTMEYEDVIKEYKKIYNINKNSLFSKDVSTYSVKTNNKLLMFIFIILILLLLYYYYNKYLRYYF